MIKLFTHTDLDGIGCAILAKVAFEDDVEIIYCNYDDINKKVEEFILNELDADKHELILITDISVDESLAIAIEERGVNWQLLDHHPTALYLNSYHWCDVRIENSQCLKTCGTEMLYEYLNDMGYFVDFSEDIMQNIRRFVEIVRDYDTWRWKDLGEEGLVSKKLNDLFGLYGRDDFVKWCLIQFKICFWPLYPFPGFGLDDEKVLQINQRQIDTYIKKKNDELVTCWDKFGKLFGVVFADRWVSELGNRLSELHPELDYIAMIDISGRKVSFRTIHDDIDLGKDIAHSYGGGGHAKAAGSTFGEDIIGAVFCGLFGEIGSCDCSGDGSEMVSELVSEGLGETK